MRTGIVSLFLFLSISAFSQTDTLNTGKADSSSLQQVMDSTNKYLEDLKQKEWEERNMSGLKLLMEQQNESRKKEIQRAMIRIGIGALFLVILIIGLIRKRRKTVN